MPLVSAPALVFVLIIVVYGVGADLSWRFFGATNLELAFFPPAGITLAALVLLPRRAWWAVVAAVLVSETGVDLIHGLGWPQAVGYAAANALEPVVGALLLARLTGGRVDLERFGGAFRFLLAAVCVGPAVGGALGGAVRYVTVGGPWWSTTLHWWAGDGLAVLAIGTTILVLGDIPRPRSIRALVEPAAALTATLAVSVTAFWWWQRPPTIFVLPVLVWVAVRFGVRGVAVASTIIALVANVATSSDRGPFTTMAGASTQTQLAWLQVFLATLIVTAWYLAIETQGRVRARAREEQERAARERAESVRALGALSAHLVHAVTVEDVVGVVEDHLRRLVRADHAVLTL